LSNIEDYQSELSFLNKHSNNSIMISTTSKHALKYRILPRRVIFDNALSCFMINDTGILREILTYFDGKVNSIYVDVEQKQDINLFKIARDLVKNSQLIAVKPNDTTLESCDLLIRHQLNDDLYNKNVIVVGTGNLASKIAVRLAERQANVFIKGRTTSKENALIDGLNLFLPKNTALISSLTQVNSKLKADVIISFLSGPLAEEDILLSFITDKTIIIDGGINNFSSNFIQRMLSDNINISRLDTRIALPYQMLSKADYTRMFFNEIYGQNDFKGVKVASGGYIGAEGTVIVDNIKSPRQLIGIADGRGGVKKNEQLTETERNRLQKIKQIVSELN